MGTGGIDGGDGIVGGGEDLGGGAFKGGFARVESEADGALPPRPLRLPPRPLAPRRRTFLKDSLKVGSAARFTGSPLRGMPVHTGAFGSPANSALMHSCLSMSEAALLSVGAIVRRATERGEGVNIAAAARYPLRCGARHARKECSPRLDSAGFHFYSTCFSGNGVNVMREGKNARRISAILVPKIVPAQRHCPSETLPSICPFGPKQHGPLRRGASNRYLSRSSHCSHA